MSRKILIGSPCPHRQKTAIRRNRKRMKNSMNAIVTTFTVTLTEEQAQKLAQQAQQAGTSPEELMRQHIAAWLDTLPTIQADFTDAAAYVLQKNAELYRRLS